MKLIDKKAFALVLVAILGYWAIQIIDTIISLAAISTVLESSLYSSLVGDLDTAALESYVRTITIIGAVIAIGLSSIFLFKLLKHRKEPKKGTYLTVLLVFACIIGGLNLFTLFTGNLMSLLALAVMGFAIGGYILQRKAPFVAPPVQAYPYGQPTPPIYGQQPNPYGNPAPYQQPMDPYANPYQQPQDPNNRQ